MFDIRQFIMKTLKGMIGKYPDFQVREYALNWYGKGKITEEDLSEIDRLIEEKNAEEIIVEEENTEVPGMIANEEVNVLEN